MAASLRELLQGLIQPGVSDVFITAGKIPSVRFEGEVTQVRDCEPVTAAAIDELRDAVLDATAAADYLKSGGSDASLDLGGCRCRLNFLSSLNGPALVMRPVSAGADLDFDKLGLPGEALRKLASLERGIVFVAGGTGSGKTTTLNAMVNYINRNFSRHVLTLEDPIEYVHSDMRSLITQREVRGGDFGTALRNAVRENPDVIVVGEMRDAESVRAALSAALTGHLVLGTVHCTNSVTLFERLLGFFPESERYRIAADMSLSFEAVLAQRLLAGISGAVPAVELLLGTATVRKHLANSSLEGVEMTLLEGGSNGMITFNQSLFDLVKNEKITKEAALTASDTPEELELRFRGIRRGGGGSSADSAVQHASGLNMRDLFHTAVRMHASDVVLTHNMPPLLRIEGEMRPLDFAALSAGDIRRLLFSVVDRHRRAIFEERKELDFSLSVPVVSDSGRAGNYRFRMNAYFQRGVPAVVARMLDERIPPPEELGLPPVLLNLVGRRQGLLLVTGPTGSGKSTTLASLLEVINQRRRAHIITIEDPVEFVYTNRNSVIEQREVGLDTKSFAAALRAALRQAPDVIMVGELRDPETVAAALTAAETGHLVMGTIHTNRAAQTVDRVIDSFPQASQNQIRQQFASSLLAVVSQRLLKRADGKGRVAAFEIMVGTPPIRALIREGRGHQLEASMETGSRDGMQTMRHVLDDLVQKGVVTAQEASSLES